MFCFAATTVFSCQDICIRHSNSVLLRSLRRTQQLAASSMISCLNAYIWNIDDWQQRGNRHEISQWRGSPFANTNGLFHAHFPSFIIHCRPTGLWMNPFLGLRWWRVLHWTNWDLHAETNFVPMKREQCHATNYVKGKGWEPLELLQHSQCEMHSKGGQRVCPYCLYNSFSCP